MFDFLASFETVPNTFFNPFFSWLDGMLSGLSDLLTSVFIA